MHPVVLLSFLGPICILVFVWAHEPMSPEVPLSWLTLKSLSISLVIPATKLFFYFSLPTKLCRNFILLLSYAYHLIHCHHLIHLSSQRFPTSPLNSFNHTLLQMAATVATATTTITTQRQQACILLSFLLLFLCSEGSKMERSLIGSRPPRCERKCMSCGHCEAVQVPSVPQEINSWSDDSNYKPLSWKCKCGNKIINP